MNENKSCYQFQLQGDPQLAYQTMQNFLNANGFKLVQKGDAIYYMSNDAIVGRRFFEYYFQGNALTIYAYIGSYKKPMLLDDKFVGTVAKQAYKNILDPLLAELNRMSGQSAYAQSGSAQGGYAYNPSVQQSYAQGSTYDTFAAQSNKTRESQAIAAFVLSILELLLSLAGVYYGAIIVIMELYLAYNGLKSKYRTLSIMTFILCAASIAFIIFQII